VRATWHGAADYRVHAGHDQRCKRPSARASSSQQMQVKAVTVGVFILQRLAAALRFLTII